MKVKIVVEKVLTCQLKQFNPQNHIFFCTTVEFYVHSRYICNATALVDKPFLPLVLSTQNYPLHFLVTW